MVEPSDNSNRTKGVVTNYRQWGLQNGRRHMKFYPKKRGGGAEKALAMLKGGTTSFGVVFTL